MVTVCPSQFATRRTLFHVLVGCGLLMLKVSRLKLPVIWLLVSIDRKSGSAGMPRPISYAVFCLKKKNKRHDAAQAQIQTPFVAADVSVDGVRNGLSAHHQLAA